MSTLEQSVGSCLCKQVTINAKGIKKNLGAEGYYSAIYNSKFVIGNSSSGVIEVPYSCLNKLSKIVVSLIG